MDYNKIKMLIINSIITKGKEYFYKSLFLEKYMVLEDKNPRIEASERGPILEEQTSKGTDSKLSAKI